MTNCLRPWIRSSTEFLASRKHQTQDSAGFVIGAWPALIASECVDTAKSPRPDCRLVANVIPYGSLSETLFLSASHMW